MIIIFKDYIGKNIKNKVKYKNNIYMESKRKMSKSQEEYRKMCEELINETGAKVKFKEESKFIKFCNFFVKLFNKRFMTDYVNVIGTTIWFPTRKGYEESDKQWLYCFLKHECHHVISTKRCGVLGMIFTYGLPQSLALLSVPADVVCATCFGILSLPVLVLSVLSVLFLIPWPSVCRVKEEVEAEVDAEMARIEEGLISKKEILFKNVCSWEYYNPMYKVEWAKKMFDRKLEDRQVEEKNKKLLGELKKSREELKESKEKLEKKIEELRVMELEEKEKLVEIINKTENIKEENNLK